MLYVISFATDFETLWFRFFSFSVLSCCFTNIGY
jgi:hypothetical protein